MPESDKLVFYDLELLNKPGLVWSPSTCKTRYALNLKNIPYETKWVNFVNIETIISPITKLSERPRVPIIVHNDQPVVESWDIAVYLEAKFPNTPSLFNGNAGLHKFFLNYANKHIIMPVYRIVVLDIRKSAGDEKMKEWFRQDREAGMQGQTLEQFAGDVNENIAELKTGMSLVSMHLAEFLFVTGDQPGWADVVLLSYLTFLVAFRPEILESAVLSDEKIRAWWNRTEYIRTGVRQSNV